MSITYKEFNKIKDVSEEKIVELLKSRPMYVQEMAEAIGVIQPRISVLLRKMIAKGQLTMKPVGPRNYYGLKE